MMRVPSVVMAAVSTVNDFLAGCRRTLERSIVRDAPSIPLLPAMAYFLLFSAIALGLMLAHNEFFQSPMGDQLYWQAISAYHRQFADWYSVVNADPLQGMFDVLPQGYRSGPLFHLLYGLPIDPHLIYALVHAIFAIYTTFAVWLLARAAGAAHSVALLAGIAFSVATVPILGSYWGVVTHIFAVTINYAYIQSAVLVAIALFWMVDDKLGIRFFASVAAALIILVDASNAMALHMTLYVPAVLVFGIAGLFASRNRAEFSLKLLWAFAVASTLLALGFAHYVLATGSDLAYTFFFKEMNDFSQYGGPRIEDLFNDFLYVVSWRGNPNGLTAAAVATLGLASALYYSVFGVSRRFRIFCRSLLALVVVMTVVVIVLHYPMAFLGRMYRGPNAYHMTYVFWPLYVIVLARALHDLTIGLIRLLWSTRSYRREQLAIHVLLLGALAVPLYQFLPLAQHRQWTVPIRDLDLTIRHNAITSYMDDKIGLEPGAVFGGSFNNFVGFSNKGKEHHNLAHHISTVGSALGARTGNDLTKHALWVLGIPTLQQESVTITAQLYLMVRELLTRPEDRQVRSFLIPTRPAQNILELWGVRFVLIDRELRFGRLVMTEAADRNTNGRIQPEPKQFGLPLRLYELQRANRGNYSPTSLVRVDTADEVVALMRDPDFDGRKRAIVTEPLAGDFVPARDARMIVRKGGFDLQASSEGDSLLVLPVQFSHCWTISGKGEASLFRANLMQLGVRFQGDLDLQVRQLYGPYWHSACRLENAEDLERLKIRRVGSEIFLEDTPDNLIPGPDNLHETLGNSQIAGLTADGDDGSQVYALVPKGGAGEHYVAQSVTLDPGSYRLEMLVKPETTGTMRLQLIGSDGRGSIGDFYLRAGETMRTDVGGASGLADIELLADGWVRISLATTSSASTLTWYLQIADQWGRLSYGAGGQRLRIKDVRLTRGRFSRAASAE